MWPAAHPPRRRPQQREKNEQALIVQLLRTLGARVYVSGTRRRRGDFPGTMQTPGIPDVEAFLPRPRWCDLESASARQLLKIEVKAKGGRLTPEQREYQELCAAASIAHIVGGLDDVIAWLTAHRYLRSAR